MKTQDKLGVVEELQRKNYLLTWVSLPNPRYSLFWPYQAKIWYFLSGEKA
ncbi:hypothetical protein [Dapis sp. BLCC M126]